MLDRQLTSEEIRAYGASVLALRDAFAQIYGYRVPFVASFPTVSPTVFHRRLRRQEWLLGKLDWAYSVYLDRQLSRQGAISRNESFQLARQGKPVHDRMLEILQLNGLKRQVKPPAKDAYVMDPLAKPLHNGLHAAMAPHVAAYISGPWMSHPDFEVQWTMCELFLHLAKEPLSPAAIARVKRRLPACAKVLEKHGAFASVEAATDAPPASG